MNELLGGISFKPEYLHVLLNPIPTHVLPVGIALLAAAIYFRNRELSYAGLFVIIASCAIAFPVYELGEKAYDRMAARADDDGQNWLDEHSRRAERLVPLFYVEAVLAATAALALRKDRRSQRMLLSATLVFGGLLMATGGYVAYAGGKVSHLEFRPAKAVTETESVSTDSD